MSLSSLLHFCQRSLILLMLISLFQVAIAGTTSSNQSLPSAPYWVQEHQFQLQARLAYLDAKIDQQKGISEDVKSIEKEILELKVSLAKQEAQAGNQLKIQESQLDIFGEQTSGRISDFQFIAGGFFAILTVALGFGAYLIFRHSEDVAEKEMKKFIDSNKDKLLEKALIELAKIREDINKNIASVSEQSLKSHSDFGQQIEQLRELANAQVDGLLTQVELKQKDLNKVDSGEPPIQFSAQQKRQLDLTTQLKPESEFSPEDWYRRSTAQLANNDFNAALTSINHAFNDKNKLKDADFGRYLSRKASCYWYLGNVHEALLTYDQLLMKLSNSSASELQELIARALFNKGVILGQLDKFDEAIAVYDQILRDFSTTTSPMWQELIAQTLLNKGVTLKQSKKPEEALATYEQLLNTFSKSDAPHLQELIAKALLNKGYALGEKGDILAAMGIYEMLLSRFAETKIPAIHQQVEYAYANIAELAILCESTEQVLKRITDCENVASYKQILAIMQFLRFILNDKTITEVIDSIHKIPPKNEFLWNFSEIKSYIYTHVNGERLTHCQAVIAFFEDHRDLARLAAEVGVNELVIG